jgi:hypothetical protein
MIQPDATLSPTPTAGDDQRPCSLVRLRAEAPVRVDLDATASDGWADPCPHEFDATLTSAWDAPDVCRARAGAACA